MIRPPLLAIWLLSLSVVACYLPGDDTGLLHGIGIENRSTHTVDIVYVAPGGEEHLVVDDFLALAGTALLPPGVHIGECNEGTLRAVDERGEVIAETSERLCDGDDWVIPAGS